MGVAKSDGRGERGGRGSAEGGGIVLGALCDVCGCEAEACPLACCCIMSAENGEPGKGMSMCSPPCPDGVACTSITTCYNTFQQARAKRIVLCPQPGEATRMLLSHDPCQHNKTQSTHMLHHMQSLPCFLLSDCAPSCHGEHKSSHDRFQAGSGITKADQKPLPVHL